MRQMRRGGHVIVFEGVRAQVRAGLGLEETDRD